MAYALIGLDKDLLDALAGQVVAIFDPSLSGEVWGIPVIGGDEAWPAFADENAGVEPLLAVDPPGRRRDLAAHYGHDRLASWVAPDADVSARATLGRGAVVQRRAYVSADVRLDDGVRINVGAQVHHDCTVGSFSTVAPGARLMGAVTVGRGVYIGAGATVLQGVTVGDDAVVGAGSVVTKPVAPGATVVGVPAGQREPRA